MHGHIITRGALCKVYVADLIVRPIKMKIVYNPVHHISSVAERTIIHFVVNEILTI